MMAKPSIVTSPATDAFAHHLMSVPCDPSRPVVVAFIGRTAYRMHHWTLKTVDGRDELHVAWEDECDLIKKSTIPWRWRLKWRLLHLWRKIL